MPHKRAKRSAREQKRAHDGHNLAPAKSVLTNEAIPKGAARVLNAAHIQGEWRQKRKLGLDEGDGGPPRKKKQKVSNECERKSGHIKDSKGAIRIMPGESLGHFNRRVEESLRPAVRDAMQSSAAIARKVRKEEEAERAAAKLKRNNSTKKKGSEDDSESRPISTAKGKQGAGKGEEDLTPTLSSKLRPERATDFVTHSSSAPRRLNDIVQAPPEINKLPRGAKLRQVAKSDGTTALKGQSLRDGVLSMAQKAMLEEERDRVIKAYREMKKRDAGE